VKEREGPGGVEGMHKKGQMVAADRSFYRGYCGLGTNKHSHNTIVTLGPFLQWRVS